MKTPRYLPGARCKRVAIRLSFCAVLLWPLIQPITGIRPGLTLCSGTPEWRHACLSHLVKQRCVADPQGTGSHLAVPAMDLQHSQNDLPFQLLGCLSDHFFQRNHTVGWNLRIQAV